MNESELHLFVLWEHSRVQEAELLEDIRQNFEVLDIYEITWSREKFTDNLMRFYGGSFKKEYQKERLTGKGPFLLVVVVDKQPTYAHHNTLKGEKYINSNTFLAKQKYRELVKIGDRIHATNTPEETNHDLAMLLGVSTADYLKQKKSGGHRIKKLKRDISGASGWKDLEELFYILNSTTQYIVLRNFEPLPKNYYLEEHGDIDLLVEDYDDARLTMNARPVFLEDYRIHNKVKVAGQDVLFDLRFVGDNYYDTKWEKELLNTRELDKRRVYVPTKQQYFHTLLYHALIHKPQVAKDYISRLNILRPKNVQKIDDHFFSSAKAHKVLGRYIAQKGYSLSVPYDQSVFVNQENFKKVRNIIYISSPLKYSLRKVRSLF